VSVWAVVEQHRVVSVWTTEEAAWKAADPERRQLIVEADLLADFQAFASEFPEWERIALEDAQ